MKNGVKQSPKQKITTRIQINEIRLKDKALKSKHKKLWQEEKRQMTN